MESIEWTQSTYSFFCSTCIIFIVIAPIYGRSMLKLLFHLFLLIVLYGIFIIGLVKWTMKSGQEYIEFCLLANTMWMSKHIKHKFTPRKTFRTKQKRESLKTDWNLKIKFIFYRCVRWQNLLTLKMVLTTARKWIPFGHWILDFFLIW